MPSAEYQRLWRQKNKDKSAKYMRSWRAKHPDKALANARKWREENHEKSRLASLLWHREHAVELSAKAKEDRKANPEKYRQYEKNKKPRDPSKQKANRRRTYLKNREKVLKYTKEYAKTHKEMRTKASREWMKRNIVKHRAAVVFARKKWRIKNPELAKKQDAVNYEKRKDAMKDSAKRWRDSHPYHRNVYNSRRRAQKASSGGKHTVKQWLDRVAFHGWTCYYCFKPLTEKTVTKDHSIPLSKGGTDFASNLVPCCLKCNTKKQTKLLKRGHFK